MEFRILGPLEVRDGGRVLDLGGPKPRGLLAILLVHAGEVVSSEQVIDGLWGEAPPRSATHLLHVYVSSLRKALEPDPGASSGSVLELREYMSNVAVVVEDEPPPGLPLLGLYEGCR